MTKQKLGFRPKNPDVPQRDLFLHTHPLAWTPNVRGVPFAKTISGKTAGGIVSSQIQYGTNIRKCPRTTLEVS